MLILSTLFAVAILLLAALLMSQDRLLLVVFGPEGTIPIDLENLKRSGKPNDYLVCPKGFGTAKARRVTSAMRSRSS